MIEKVNMFSAKCDHCHNPWHDDHNGWSAMGDELTMETVLSDSEWHKGCTKFNEGKDNEHYCPDCFHYDDDDKFILSPERKGKFLKQIVG